jgi:hypothetical protein
VIGVKAVQKEEFKSFEWVEVTIDSELKVLLLYRPPPSKKNKLNFGDFLREFNDLLDMYCTETLPLIIIGDINVKVNRMDDPEAIKYLRLLASHGLKQYVDKPTHRSGNTLDNIIGRLSGNPLLDFSVNPGKSISDHFPIFFGIQARWNFQRPIPVPRRVRKLKDLNIPALAADISMQTEPWWDTDDAISAYSDIMRSLLDKHAPMKTIQIKGETKKPWYNNDIHSGRCARRRLERQWIKSGLEVHRQMLVQQGKIVVTMISKAKSDYFRVKLSNCPTKIMFREVNSLLSPSLGGELPRAGDKVELANRFDLQTSSPTKWKTSGKGLGHHATKRAKSPCTNSLSLVHLVRMIYVRSCRVAHPSLVYWTLYQPSICVIPLS